MASPSPAIHAALADRYRFEREIGSGATATVYLAHDVKHGRRVAVKVLRPEFGATLAAERFLREIAIAAQLQHPHILPLLDSGEAGGTLFFVLPFVEGETLRERVRREGKLPIPEAVRVLADVADALVYAHARGVVHRDIKPDNIMLTGRNAVVMDFGVAKALNAAARSEQLTTGIALGTPAYMAPEQALADPKVDHRADLYALGVVAYEMLTGRPPFSASTPQELLTAHVVLTPETVTAFRPEVPPLLAEVVMRALAKQPDERWQSAEEMVARLDPLATPSGGVTPAGLAPVARGQRRVIGVAVVVGALGVAAAIWSFASRRAEPPVEVRPQPLTFSGTVAEAAIAPDGQFLAYVGQGPAGHRLFVQDLAGDVVLPLVAGERIVGLSWSADATEIAYSLWTGESPSLRAISRLGGPQRTLLGRMGFLSPDRRKAAFGGSAEYSIGVVDLQTGDTTRLERSRSYRWITGLAWSQASDRLVIAVNEAAEARSALAALPLDGPEEIVVADSVAMVGPVWDSAGSAIYYLRGDNGVRADLMRVRVDREGRRRGSPTLVAPALEVRYGRSMIPIAPLSITRDGRRLVYTQQQRWSNLGQVRLDPRGGEPEPEFYTMGTALYGDAAVSPDASTLAVVKLTPTGASIGVVPVGGSTIQEIDTYLDAAGIAWAPSGAMLAFNGLSAGGGYELAVHDRRDGITKRVQRGRVGSHLTWAGSTIVVQAAGNRYFLAVDPASGAARPLLADDTTGWMFSPRASPDGRLLAFDWNRPPRGHGMWIASLSDTARRQVAAGRLSPLRWSADGRSVYALRDDGRGAELLLVGVDGAVQRIYRLPPDFEAHDLYPDERTLLVNRVNQRSDAIALDLIRSPR
jgi:serine/threonine-protein kinase